MSEKRTLTRRDATLYTLYALLFANIGYLGKTFWDLNIYHDLVDLAIKEATGVTAKQYDQVASIEQCVNRGRAWVVVHRGFTQKQKEALAHMASYDQKEYREYLQNTKRLIDTLARLGEPVILVVEGTDFDGKKMPTPVCTSYIVTHNASGKVKKYIYTDKGLRIQNIDRLKTHLKNAGVHTVNFAGEIGSHKLHGLPGCVPAVAEQFKDSFKIKGVEGCIYPMRSGWWWEGPIQKTLYYDRVPIPTA
jgi:hypothetical protein